MTSLPVPHLQIAYYEQTGAEHNDDDDEEDAAVVGLRLW